ncbi:hypothetical protein DM02DRAFT_663272 [Periconia macrospinosa]|uniref:Kelch repeat protein n=1 Tax=Periconia macrospinosa TaxID=97972 RepID=A0A2V1D248_9PLEO|nr:hypothetical protein DM02DRAFT_663272 [Periconia macrospinosa]
MLRDKSVFVDGGVQLYRKNGSTWLGFSKYIFEIDMSAPWDATTNFTEKRIGRFGNSAMNANPPNMVRGALYRGPAEDRRLFTFGGSTFLANQSDPDWKSPDSDKYSLWSYDTQTMAWGQYDITHAVPRRPNWGAATEAISIGIGFFLNGQVDRGSSSVMYSMTEYINGTLTHETDNQITYLGGMIIVDLATAIARNVSTHTLGDPRVAGGLVHCPRFGKTENGTLVTFGGMRSGNEKNNTFNNSVLIDFNTVSLCDTFNEADVIWFNQSTSGEAPPPRIDFCVLPGVKSAKDNSSHNVYIYGGYDPTKSIMYDDVYVLSLPSFTWTKVYSGENPKFGHTCHTAGKRQMMTVGGLLDASMYAVETTGQLPNLTTTKCDKWGGVALFDLSNLTWGSSFNLYAPEYQVPGKVVDAIGGSGDGSATMTEPVSGFAHAALSTMFNPPPPTSPSPPTSPPSNPPRPEDSHNAHIAGAVVGAVAGIVIIVGLIAWILHRRRRALPSHELPGESAQKKDIKSKCQELPVDSPLVELPEDQRPAELQDERRDSGVPTSPSELPAEEI